MPELSIDQQIRARIDDFVDELSALVREAAIEAVGEALRDGPATAGGGVRPAAHRKTAKKVSRKKTAGKRVRRSAEQIKEISEQVLAHVRANPGTRMGDIVSALGMEAKDLRRSVQELISAKRLRTKGQKRATEYFAGGRARGKRTVRKKAARKATKKKAGRRASKKSTASAKAA